MPMWNHVTDAQRESLVAEFIGHLPQSGIPEHLRPGLVRYFSDGILPGSFLQAVLCNDLAQAMMRAADRPTLLALPDLVRYLSTFAPSIAWGSYDAVSGWTTTLDRLEIAPLHPSIVTRTPTVLPPDDAAIVPQMVEEIEVKGVIELHLTAPSAFQLAALLQLALRPPGAVGRPPANRRDVPRPRARVLRRLPRDARDHPPWRRSAPEPPMTLAELLRALRADESAVGLIDSDKRFLQTTSEEIKCARRTPRGASK
jgi:hypothetical protein